MYINFYKEVIIIKIDKTVLKETSFVAIWMLILSGIMQAVFLIIGKDRKSVV